MRIVESVGEVPVDVGAGGLEEGLWEVENTVLGTVEPGVVLTGLVEATEWEVLKKLFPVTEVPAEL